MREVLAMIGVAIVLLAVTELLRRAMTLRRERDARARDLEVLSRAVAELTGVRSSNEVLEAAVRIAASLVSPSFTSERRAVYFAVDGDIARVLAEHDESGRTGAEVVALAEHPPLARVVATGAPVTASFGAEPLRGAADDSVRSTSVTHGAAVPVVVDGRLHGVLAVGGRGRPISDVARLVDIAGVVQLALEGAVAGEELHRHATTDVLTGCLNRRGLEVATALLPGRRPFAVVVADLDHLKEINDGHGHERGDAALVGFAAHLGDVVRGGDAIARVGGDEFLVLLHDADLHAAERLAARILTRPNTAVSVGVAAGSEPGAFEATWRRADAAMYAAKRAGGNRYAVGEPSPAQ